MSLHLSAERPLRVTHVVESFGAGVLEAVRMLTELQLAHGLEVDIVHSRRPDTPDEEELDRMFPAPARRHPLALAQGIAPLADLRGLLQLRTMLRALRPDIIHLHSSKAGLLGRLAARLLGLQRRVIYSPHGWAFLRADVTHAQRKLFLSLEQLGSHLGGCIAACSQHELELARAHIRNCTALLLRNAVPISPPPPRRSRHDIIQVLAVGRITEQKAPWHFAKLAAAFADAQVRFVWVGDDQHPQRDAWLGEAPVTVTGRLPREGVRQAMADADIFVMLSDWEGLPLALVEAQAMGLPALVNSLPGCLEVVMPEVTGLVADTPEEMMRQLGRLLAESRLRQALGQAAALRMREAFSLEGYAQRVLALYSRIAAEKAPT